MEEEYLGQKMLERLIGHEVPEICVPIALMVFSHVIRENSTSADIMDEVNFFKSSILYRANPNSLSQRAEAYLASLKSQIRSEFINESEITDPAEAAFRTAEGITVREERDRILKESYLKQASELGLGKASCLYSEILFRDQAKKENADLAVYYATKAVSQGYWHGYRQLAAIQHYLGSPEEEKRFLTLGAEKNDGSCLDRLGRILDNQEDTSSQIAQAIYYFEKAAQVFDLGGSYDYARTFLGTKYGRVDIEKAENLFQFASDLGSTEADSDLGRHYMDGTFGSVDLNKSAFYLQRGIELEDRECLYWMAYLYAGFVDGFEPDYDKAAKAFRFLASKGDGRAAFNLGCLAREGNGMPQDANVAVRYFVRGAQMGNAQCALEAGEMYQDGVEVERDVDQAVYLLGLAGRLGEKEGYRLLAEMYMKGDGVLPDPDKAKDYLNRASGSQA